MGAERGADRVTVAGHAGRRMASTSIDIALYAGTVCLSAPGAQAIWVDAVVLKAALTDLERHSPTDFTRQPEMRDCETCDDCGVLYDESYCPRCEEMN